MKCFKNGNRRLEIRKAVWPKPITEQSLSGSTGAMETHPSSIK
jgi:hypothetical protein